MLVLARNVLRILSHCSRTLYMYKGWLIIAYLAWSLECVYDILYSNGMSCVVDFNSVDLFWAVST